MSVEQSRNFSVIVTEVGGVVYLEEEDYDRVLTDLWVGITLGLMVVSCIGILCSCFLYHKFQQWKFEVLESRAHQRQNPEAGYDDTESLPSYTLVTGLPSYAEAMEQLKQVHCITGKGAEPIVEQPQQNSPSTVVSLSSLSVSELLQFYRPPNFKQ